jgi:hypothetical protein
VLLLKELEAVFFFRAVLARAVEELMLLKCDAKGRNGVGRRRYSVQVTADSN